MFIISEQVRTDLFTISGLTTVTSSGDEGLGHSIKADSLGLPTSPFLFDLLDYEITLTTELLYGLGLSAQLCDIRHMCRRQPNDLGWYRDLVEEFIPNKQGRKCTISSSSFS